MPDLDLKDAVLDIRGTVMTDTGKVVYQGCSEASANFHNANGQPMMQRAYVIPNDPKTAPQLACRARMRAAVLAWQALSDAEKNAWTNYAHSRNISGYNAFIGAQLEII